MKKYILPLLCVLVFAQCKKDSNNPAPNDSYMPLTVGSNWTYIDNPGGTYTVTVSNKDTLAGSPGISYKVLTSTNGVNQYFANQLTNHYRFTVLPGILPEGFSELYLKSDANVNATWNNTVPMTIDFGGFPLQVTVVFKNTIMEKGGTKTVQGKNYTNVIRVKVDATATVLGQVQNLGGGNFYYSKGVGMIAYDMNLTVPGSPASTQTSELVSYQIK